MVTMAVPLLLILSIFFKTEIPSRRWHRALHKSPSTPPPAFHAIAWVVCLCSSGWAARLVLTALVAEGGEDVVEDDVVLALGAFAMQLAITVSWMFAFFGMRRTVLGYLIMRGTCVAVGVCIVAFARVSPLAASLLVPYLGWLVFLTYLNGYMARNNPPAGGAKKEVPPPVVGGGEALHPHSPLSRGGSRWGKGRDVAALLKGTGGEGRCSRSPSCGGAPAWPLAPPAPGACSPVTPMAVAAPSPSAGLGGDRDALASWDLLNASIPSRGMPPPPTSEVGSTRFGGAGADWPPVAGADVPPSPLQRGPSRPPHDLGGGGGSGGEPGGGGSTDSSDGSDGREVQESGSAVTADGDR